MPLVNIKLAREATPITPEQKKALIEGATDLLVKVLNKNRATTIVIIEELDSDNWGIGGNSVTEIRKKS
ncbi:tautomerase family protein [Helicobacter cynogastricus]|uniref:tautomerase family protein n=1 Tax=Helicobacter cynogastricus TaxID=329937 RepID=UPI000CF04965|nr:4-oxalocrotonate tautomerase family protein [Helicobacter cynogastricus]